MTLADLGPPTSTNVAGPFDSEAAKRTAGLPPLSPRRQLARAVLVTALVMTLALLLHLVVVSGIQHSASQGRRRDEFRSALALGTAPIGPLDADQAALAPGTPVALLEIPDIGVDEIVGEGTTASVLFDGPGHRRDTPLPGQAGVSVLFGRRSSFGGPFGRISELGPGDEVIVTTGQGEFTFRVAGVRREGDPLPGRLESDAARITLTTADGSRFLPGGVLRVDADLVGTAVGGAPRVLTSATLPDNEGAMAIDTSRLWALALWLQLFVALSLAAVWSWRRWGAPQSWVIFTPSLVLIGLATAGELARLTPNLS